MRDKEETEQVVEEALDLSNVSDEDLDDAVYEVPVEQEEVTETEEVEEETTEEVVDEEQTTEEQEVQETEAVTTDEETEEVSEEDEPEETVEPTGDANKEFYDAVTKPLKADGSEHVYDDPEKIRRLVQMGTGFHKYKNSIKPAVKLGTTIQDNDIDDEGLSLMIDAYKGNPKAIRQILENNELTPLDLDLSEEDSYEPNTNNIVTDSELQLKEVISTLGNNPNFKAIAQEIGDWDKESRDLIADNPETLKVFTAHKESGFYEKVQSTMSEYSTLGYLPADAPYAVQYQLVAEELLRQADTKQNESNSPESSEVKIAKAKKVANLSRNTSRKSNTAPAAKVIDLSKLSDEELEKLT